MDRIPTERQYKPVRKLVKATKWQIAGLSLVIMIVLFWLVPVVWTMFVPVRQ